MNACNHHRYDDQAKGNSFEPTAKPCILLSLMVKIVTVLRCGDCVDELSCGGGGDGGIINDICSDAVSL